MPAQKVRVSCQMRPQNGDCLLVPSHEDVGNTFFEFVEGWAVRVEPFGLFHAGKAFRGLARAAKRCTHPKTDPSRSGREGYSPFAFRDGLVILLFVAIQTAQPRVSWGVRVIQTNRPLLQFDRAIQCVGSAVLLELN